MNPSNENLAPHSQEAEEALLGAVLINNDALIEASAIIKVDDLFFLRNQYVFEAMLRLDERHDIIDILTISEELKNQGRLDAIGGRSYLTYLLSESATAMHAEVYAGIVARTATRRRLLKASSDISHLAKSEDMAVEAVVQEAQSVFFSAIEGHQSEGDLQSIFDIASADYDRLQPLVENNQITGLPTGFDALDAALGGLQDTDLLILAGRPGMGKTSLQGGITANVGRAGGIVAVFSAEMSKAQYFQRMVASESGLDMAAVRNGSLTHAQWNTYQTYSGIVSSWPVFIDDTVAITPEQMLTRARRLQHRHGLSLIIIDHLGKLGKGNNRDEYAAISHNVAQCKDLARRLGVPVLLAAQLNREVEKRPDKRPKLSDLRDSGRIEEEADVVMFLYRDEYYNPNTPDKNTVEIAIAKNRNGKTSGDDPVLMGFKAHCTKFTNDEVRKVNLTDWSG